ncbi:hypothetical protein EVAR_102876_1 [Eumeta japonica]|uniref:Uncharacterized protein n=1 Tax=Eumeta variegata TaxID=151549 RepID=A0A4C1UNS9_EUMVA|nr:hypothetical protein EVAR_102876_1 [Eumeta japonica]
MHHDCSIVMGNAAFCAPAPAATSHNRGREELFWRPSVHLVSTTTRCGVLFVVANRERSYRNCHRYCE